MPAAALRQCTTAFHRLTGVYKEHAEFHMATSAGRFGVEVNSAMFDSWCLQVRATHGGLVISHAEEVKAR